MYILKNAWISITRNKGRNILIGVIILVIACACTITLAINNTASDLISSYESLYDKEITLTFDRTAMMKDFDISKEEGMKEAQDRFSNIDPYSMEDVENFATNEHILNYHYTYTIALNGNDIEKAESDFSMGGPGGNRGGGKFGNNLDFTLTGYSSIESMNEFIDGTYTMNEITENAWDVAFSGNYVFINQELASYNELGLNDIIKLEDETGQIYEFEIIGIFEDNDTENSSRMNMFSNSVNTIVTNASALVNIDDGNDEIDGSITPTFIIDDYDNAELIKEDFYSKGLDESYTISTNEEIALTGVSSIQNVKSFATTFLIISLLIGGIVLFIINMINIRERKYEIGVFRTIGFSKLKLTSQFICELFIVGFVALLLGAGFGATMSKGVSNSLLANEIESSKQETEQMKNNFGGGRGGMMNENFQNQIGKIKGTNTVQAYDKVDAVVDTTVVLELLGIGLILIILSSSASLISIQRFSPLTILKERT